MLRSEQYLSVVMVILVAVTAISAVACLVSIFLVRYPAVRHGVLLSALLAVLSSPVFAVIFFASGNSWFAMRWPIAVRKVQKSSGTISVAPDQRVWCPMPDVQEGSRKYLEEKGSRFATPQTAEGKVEFEKSLDRWNVAIAMIWWAISIWVLGTIICCVAMLRGNLFIRRLRRSLQPANHLKLNFAWNDVVRLSQPRRRAGLMISPLARTPMAVGVFRPIIVLPPGLSESITTTQLCNVLIHEIAHVQRLDNLVIFLQSIAGALFWPIPFVRILNGQLAQAREDVCDNYVLAHCDPMGYGQTLLRLAELACGFAAPIGAVGIFHWRGKLERRIGGMIHRSRSRTTRLHPLFNATVLVALLAVSCLLCATRIVAAHIDPTNESNPPKIAACPVNDDVPIHGRLLDSSGAPLHDAKVRVLDVLAPRQGDLNAYLAREANMYFLADESDQLRNIELKELPGLNVETHTDADGRFTVVGVGKDRLAQLLVKAPSVMDTYLTAMSHDGRDVGILQDGYGKTTEVIHAAHFSLQLEPGRTISGVVRDRDTHQPIGGMPVGRGWPGNYPRQGLMSDPIATDANGRFTISGFDPHTKPIAITAISAPGMIYLPASTDVNDDSPIVIDAPRGIPFHLKVVDEKGQPVQADVISYDVSPNPLAPKPFCYPCYKPLSQAARQADGSYVGFVSPGPGVVLVQTPDRIDYLPARVDPKAFFAPGKTDWTAQEKITSYGSADTVAVTGGLVKQNDYAAIVLVNPPTGSAALELSATIKFRDSTR